MPTVDSIPHGEPCWFDLMTSDKERAIEFYGELFGWTASTANEEFGGYTNFMLGDRMVCGCMSKDHTQDEIPDTWGVYLSEADAAASVARCEAAGATVIAPAMAVGDLGSMAILADPTGAVVGIWQSGMHTGFGARLETGTPYWFELHTRDYDAAVAFYRDAMGCQVRTLADEPGYRYTVIGGDDGAAGIMDAAAYLPEGVPSSWTVYITVDDVDATLARIVELGGSIIQPAEDTPYGRLASALDPMGAPFKIAVPPPSMNG